MVEIVHCAGSRRRGKNDRGVVGGEEEVDCKGAQTTQVINSKTD
jgi:hypothetical protein